MGLALKEQGKIQGLLKDSSWRFAPFPLCFLCSNVFHYRAEPSAVYICIGSRLQKINLPVMILFLPLLLFVVLFLFFLKKSVLLLLDILLTSPWSLSLQWGKFDCLVDYLNYLSLSATLLNTPHIYIYIYICGKINYF